MIPDERHARLATLPVICVHSAPQTRRSSVSTSRRSSSDRTDDTAAPRTCSLPSCIQRSAGTMAFSSETRAWQRDVHVTADNAEAATERSSSRTLCCHFSPSSTFASGSFPRSVHHCSSASEALSKDFLGVKDVVTDIDPTLAGRLTASELVTSEVQRRDSLSVAFSEVHVRGRRARSPSVHLSPSVHTTPVSHLMQHPSPACSPSRTLHCPRFQGRVGTLSAMLTPDTQQQLAVDGRTRTPSLDSTSSNRGPSPVSPVSYFRVVVLGGDEVGKSTLVRQLAGGDHCDTANDDFDDDFHHLLLSVELDEEESTMEVVDSPVNTDIDSLRPDAFLVVYSVSDQKSFEAAAEVIRHLRSDLGTDRTVYLVANKTDLRRQQRVSQKEGRRLADTHDCQFMETSAALRHNVDALLIGVLTHIRRQLALPGEIAPTNIRYSKRRASSPARALHFFSKLFRQAQGKRKLNTECARSKHDCRS